MNKISEFIRKILKIFIFTLVLMFICSVIYPAALTGVSNLAFKDKANGSLITADGKVTLNPKEAVGSKLIGQKFTQDKFFKGRVSYVEYNTYSGKQKENGEYTGVASGSFNYGNSNKELEKRMETDIKAFLDENPNIERKDIPIDLITASGSGLDPHISVKAAEIQIPTIVKNTGLSRNKIEEIVNNNIEYKTLNIFGEEKVNVLGCNLEIANELGM